MNELLNHPLVIKLIEMSFSEDIGSGDHTSLATINKDATGKSIIVAKEEGILAGVLLGEYIFKKVDSQLTVKLLKQDGDAVKAGDVVMEIEGSTISMLTAERTVLNFVQRLSGVSTQTNRYVKVLHGLHTQILDTRKTTPGMRLLEKWAVKNGGGANHRIGLYDMILIKDNHIDFAGGIAQALSRTKHYLQENNLNLKIEIETRSFNEVNEVLSIGGVNRIMLDNFSVPMLHEAVKMIDGRFETEASGGITLETLRGYAETGVDFISSGALTHSVKSLDLSMRAV
ncbi:nicotinate-nucleotide pyrophosphorylase [Bacteroidetes bacterium UKL13-3]|jgi:nicotinate-nucleotide pyrophosphorylase (carboxylating)|nr:nicotinate-nucleotide pyrophosphorylase [Bacteroidetes bacterium UKL13-3]HCP93628.1 carboxylating nicotinate-nucleotide diphosphorylase [Bacteroidota bacterium]